MAGGLASVWVAGDGRYMVDEPAFSEQAGDAYYKIITACLCDQNRR